MAAEIKIQLDEHSLSRLNNVMQHLTEKCQDIEGALKNIGESLLQTTHERFESQTDPQGNKWKPLSALTVKLRGSNGPILTRTGRLKSSVSYQVSGNVLKLGPNTVDAAVHQFGATIIPRDKKALRVGSKDGGLFFKKAIIPARPFIGFGAKDEQAAMDAIEDWFDMESIE